MLNNFALNREVQKIAFNSQIYAWAVTIFEFPANFLVSPQEQEQQQEQEQEQTE